MDATTNNRDSAAPPARRSRTTLERIADLKGELHAFEHERDVLRSEAEARLDALTRSATRSDARGLYAFVAACAVSLGLLTLAGNLEQPAVATREVPVAHGERLHAPGEPPTLPALAAAAHDTARTQASTPPTEPQEQELAEGVADLVSEAPLPTSDAPATATPGDVEHPQAATRKPTWRKPAARTTAVRETPARVSAPVDPLAGIDDCGDDPICGL